MTTEQIRSVLNMVVKKKFPELEVEIYISKEPDFDSPTYISKGYEIFNVFFHLSPFEYDKFIDGHGDEKKWSVVKELIKDLLKMLGIFSKVKFWYSRQEGALW